MRLRFVATLAPPVPGLGRSNAGEVVSFLPLDKIWADSRFDPSHTIEFSGDFESYNPVREGDLLVPKVSPTFAHGRTAIACGLTGGRALATSEVFVLRPDDPRDAAFLRYRLISPDFLMEGRAAWQGVAGLKRVSGDFLLSTRIAHFAWRDRHAIAEFLDRECERIRAAIRVAGDAIASLTRSERTIADAVVHGLPCLPLKAVATIHSGVTLNEAKAPADAVRVPYLRVANVKAGWLELDEIKEVPISPSDVPHYALKPGDLLLTEGGDLDKLGRGALWAGDIEPCLFQNHIFAVRPRRDAVVPAFLSWATRSSAARSYFEATASRITNIASTNRSKLGRWPVPDAPVEEQRRRVAVAESAWQRAQHAITAARNLSKALTAYRSSLIHEAVTGKLDVTKVSDRQMDERLHAAAENRLDEVPA